MQSHMFFKILLQCLLFSIVLAISKHPILIIVSYDAFRYDYFNTKNVPHMNRIRKAGTYADYLINVFPTKTFPNHHSISTGVYPETHGVMGNSFYDPKLKRVVHISPEMYNFNKDVVPIWRQNEDMGDGRHSGVMMWPGASYPYQGKSVTHIQDFQAGFDFFKRIDIVMSWIKDPKKPANLVMIYIEEPDSHGHVYGPNHEVVHEFLRKLDNVTFYLERKLEEYGLTDKANVIHLSDHGLTAVTPPHFLNVTQYLPPDSYFLGGTSPILQFTPKPGFEAEDFFERLQNGSVSNGHYKVFQKSDYPKRWHYKNNPRTPPLVVMADVGYALDDMITSAPAMAEKFHFNMTDESEFGVHGYDYEVVEMHPFFMARGPRIKKSHKVPPFNTVDLYNLFCEILEVPSTKNNGSLANIKDILAANSGRYSFSSILTITVGGILLVLLLISCAAVITIIMIKRQQSITTTAALNKRFPQTFHSSIEAQHLLESEEA